MKIHSTRHTMTVFLSDHPLKRVVCWLPISGLCSTIIINIGMCSFRAEQCAGKARPVELRGDWHDSELCECSARAELMMQWWWWEEKNGWSSSSVWDAFHGFIVCWCHLLVLRDGLYFCTCVFSLIEFKFLSCSSSGGIKQWSIKVNYDCSIALHHDFQKVEMSGGKEFHWTKNNYN